MRVLLDTAVLVYAVQSPESLSRRATTVLKNAEHTLELSSISLSELAIKSRLGKLQVTTEIVKQALHDLGIRVLPYTASHAFQLFELPLHHPDPLDRQIIAQAISESLPVVSPDEKFKLYKELRVIW